MTLQRQNQKSEKAFFANIPDDYCPELGTGLLPENFIIERWFNKLVSFLPYLSALLLVTIAVLILIDVLGRTLFSKPLTGVVDLEGLFMTIVGFGAMAYAATTRQAIQIDLFFEKFSPKNKRLFSLFSNLLCLVTTGVIGYYAANVGFGWLEDTSELRIPEYPFVVFTGVALLLTSMAYFFQTLHNFKTIINKKEYFSILIAVSLILVLVIAPWLYRYSAFRVSGLAIGAVGFFMLMSIMLIRVPLGFAMAAVGLIGFMAIVRRPDAALKTIGAIPFVNGSDVAMIAFPMFMLMGEMVFHSGLSNDLFLVARKWLGRMPGGLACASVGGCAGFGAVCGDSLATVITMSSVALPPMRENKYNNALATGALAAGGTLGILIPPSMGFIIYSMITEESVGKLFVAGILPGILLAIIFIAIIVIQVKLHPEYAPLGKIVPIKEKVSSLILLIPVVTLFVIVVFGILEGLFTPAEGGAVGAVLAFVYAVIRRTISGKTFIKSMLSSAAMFGKFFSLFIGLYVFGAFLASSRLPNLLSDFIVHLEMNKYFVLAFIILIYILLGCVMNIIPMMMLTLPSIYPTVQALGFDGIWFGVICVIVMEMGMITPPVGMNVFTLSSLVPDIPMSTIFRGVMPFFLGMLLCVIILVVFPQITMVLL